MSKGVIISQCDLTGEMVLPWVEAGYDAVLVDPQHGRYSNDGRIERLPCTVLEAACRLGEILRGRRVVFVAGFPPCTDVAVSGSRWFQAKAEKDQHFQAKAALVAEQCRMVGMLAGAPWLFENPVSVFSSIFGAPDHTFHPYHFTGLCVEDNYTKSTCLWSGGGFVMPHEHIDSRVAQAIALVCEACGRMVPKKQALEATGRNALVVEWYPDNRIHTAAPGPERANFRSATPRGFAEAVFRANAPHLRRQLHLWEAA